jgi:hypothetical protein
VAVGAPYHAFQDLSLRLRYAFSIAHVQTFIPSDVVEVKGRWMRIETTIYTSMLDFVAIDPSANRGGSLVSLFIDVLTVLGITKALLTPRFCFGWVIDALAGSNIVLFDLIGVARTPSLSGINPMFPFFLFGKHVRIVPNTYPCKPDIFEKTYEAV